MKIFSMTGFGKGEAIGANYTMTVEIKSVNNRFKDFRFKMPSFFNSVEMELKKILEEKSKRGTFDIYVNYKKTENTNQDVELDLTKINNFIEFMNANVAKKVNLEWSATSFLRNEFYKEEDVNKSEVLTSLLKEAFVKAADALNILREDEGLKLCQKIKSDLEIYRQNVDKIAPLKETYRQQINDKLKKKFADKTADLGADEARFNQEVIYYLEKYDIDEELSRIDIHLSKFDQLLKAGGEVGRKIDFIVQELGRETNTIGSKAAQDQISECVIEMKVQLERIREQALNLE